jgi:hypothetical protein
MQQQQQQQQQQENFWTDFYWDVLVKSDNTLQFKLRLVNNNGFTHISVRILSIIH